MSRSRRKNPCFGIVGSHTSEKWWKRYDHHRVRMAVKQGKYWVKRLESNWTWPKDGKCWWAAMPEGHKLWRK